MEKDKKIPTHKQRNRAFAAEPGSSGTGMIEAETNGFEYGINLINCGCKAFNLSSPPFKTRALAYYTNRFKATHKKGHLILA